MLWNEIQAKHIYIIYYCYKFFCIFHYIIYLRPLIYSNNNNIILTIISTLDLSIYFKYKYIYIFLLILKIRLKNISKDFTKKSEDKKEPSTRHKSQIIDFFLSLSLIFQFKYNLKIEIIINFFSSLSLFHILSYF